MIRYNNEIWFGYAQYFHTFGSAIFSGRCMPQALIAAVVGLFGTQNSDNLKDTVITNPGAYFSAITVVLGFLLVFRTQLAYGRYWEGRTNMQILVSKLEDVAIHTKSFVQRTDREALTWKNQMGQLLINYLALAVADLRGEEDLDTIIKGYNGYLDLTTTEREELSTSNYRTYAQMNKIVDAWVVWALKGGVSVPPPVQSRTYQIISEAQLAFNGAQKIQTTPFPYPLMQVCGFLLHVYMVTGPLVVGAFLHHWAFGTFLSFASVLGFFALNKTAEELEDPFGSDPNDLPLDTYLSTFRQSLFSLGIMKVRKGWTSVKAVNNPFAKIAHTALCKEQDDSEQAEVPVEGADAVAAHREPSEGPAIQPGDEVHDGSTALDRFWALCGCQLVQKGTALTKADRLALKRLSFYYLS
mmetsp:Transcript_27236/g.51864  ORF Transcript_27236/g.51864 Transcript_27236/m.51864 type:complete len:412 (+) Transcript_27236:72-1307(+)|eukprot:CAMPEP_0114244388 /NCGR_PEP_ID=MMETSP0058-20121206/11307_1 /TAXON_ID=36894 /ORGANISM="Pyramimonas parkeae, CCMP726" /LENGTH=411 /DNA_ID=CAMNT_0001357313 /DNA_START=71 /DNA_END=1306 /DNA_ORIENTATION=-